MDNRKTSFIIALLLFFIVKVSFAQENTIIIHANKGKDTISKHIYGHFAEHLGRGIYDGFFVGKTSEIPNINGIRKDIVEALKELKIPVLRWPGGCFAEQYQWRDGIGPVKDRPLVVNTFWGGVTEDNSFGTHEFLDLCEMLEAEPYIAINIAILTYIGIYRISKLYLVPLGRLAQRAEDYKEDDEIIFSVRKEDNELNRLSKSLNLMLKRISADKETLRSTVLSLEKSNLELKKAQKEIIQAEKLASVGRLSAGVAHEIGNPIGIVIGYLELLKQEDITPAERDEYIQRTEAEIERINTIIRQLLEISRPSSSDRTAVCVHQLIHDTASVLRVQPLISKIEIALKLAAEDDTVFADSNQLRQVFLNLIINAADAISAEGGNAGGKLEITTALETKTDPDSQNPATRLKIMFIDNGPGIAAEHLDNIFDPFFTTKDPGRGTGLGLSVSFMIIESLGGTMTVTSDIGRGTTMKITLPLLSPGLNG